MKRIYTLAVAAIIAVSSFAANYQHSIGLVGGLGLGAQYKHMVYDDFTIIEEFGYFTCTSNFGYAGAIDNLVLAYQGHAAEGQGIILDWYVGGQFKIGYVTGFVDAGLLGFGAAGGIEACMANAPIVFSFDFRPGYALQFNGNGAGGHMFDYSFNLGVRYRF